ncbi:CLUMA_CG002867, isoform A [Clunio marinus]|uniref:CLUMA_CG002867, isoform A n=1 Tax=Clunio marinus TaxID=568069 RepID=A0A1J1HQS0_9DIPT|nr:CLUMA_CG002867, isoform A [Clunio marinus]
MLQLISESSVFSLHPSGEKKFKRVDVDTNRNKKDLKSFNIMSMKSYKCDRRYDSDTMLINVSCSFKI